MKLDNLEKLGEHVMRQNGQTNAVLPSPQTHFFPALFISSPLALLLLELLRDFSARLWQLQERLDGGLAPVEHMIKGGDGGAEITDVIMLADQRGLKAPVRDKIRNIN